MSSDPWFDIQTRHNAMLVADESDNDPAMLCVPRAMAAASSGQYCLLNRTTILSPMVLLCREPDVVSASAC